MQAFQNVHGPLEVPKQYFDLYRDQGAGSQDGAQCTWERYMARGGKGFHCTNPTGVSGANCYCNRLIVKAQVSALDEAVKNLTAALTTHGLWENSVLVFQGNYLPNQRQCLPATLTNCWI
jgi:arylsulfatase A-like enzyme